MYRGEGGGGGVAVDWDVMAEGFVMQGVFVQERDACACGRIGFVYVPTACCVLRRPFCLALLVSKRRRDR